MLCPNCGTNVGDSVALCPNCAEQRRLKLEQAASQRAAEPPAPEGMTPEARKKLIGILGGCVGLLALALGTLLFVREPSPATQTVTSPQDPFYSRCIAVFQGAEKMRQEVANEFSEKEGLSGKALATFSNMVAAGSNAEAGCAAQLELCKSDPMSARCRQQRMVNDLFFVMESVCHANGSKSMATPECQQLYATCVPPPSLETPACQSLLKKYGV